MKISQNDTLIHNCTLIDGTGAAAVPNGALLIRNDPFEGTRIVDGKVTLTDLPGIGIVLRSDVCQPSAVSR